MLCVVNKKGSFTFWSLSLNSRYEPLTVFLKAFRTAFFSFLTLEKWQTPTFTSPLKRAKKERQEDKSDVFEFSASC